MDLIDGLETKDYIVAPVGTAQRQWRRYSLETTLCYRRTHRVCYSRLYRPAHMVNIIHIFSYGFFKYYINILISIFLQIYHWLNFVEYVKLTIYCSNVSTTPLWQWGFGQCLPFSWTTLLCRLY